MERRFVISVHQLVDFLLRQGSIDSRIYNKTSMTEGSRIHAYYQNKQGSSYISEYPLSQTFAVEDFFVTLQGRADGIIVSGNLATIEEIKSTVIDLNEFADSQKAWHLGQAKCYALMFAEEKGLDSINIRLVYIHQGTDEKMVRDFSFQTEDLKKEVLDLIGQYLDFFNILWNKKLERNETASHLEFPFNNFRPGQRELAKYAYSVASKGGTLFVEAPTGIGKTMSTLYPFCRSFADEFNDKIFYLTAKTSGRDAASQAVEILKEKGLKASSIVITAKDKVCFNPGSACNPDECPFAKGYYDKIRGVLTECIIKENNFSYETIVKYGIDNNICPFEFSLDLSLYSDIVICDYNYLFDPLVYMRRYFDADASHYVALIDEAHNLVERGRDMFSVTLTSAGFDRMKKSIRKLDHKKMKAAVSRLSKLFKALKEDSPLGETITEEVDPVFLRALNNFLTAGQDVLRNFHEDADDDFVDFFFEVNRFLKIVELFDESFVSYVLKNGDKDVELHIYCLDPSTQLRASFLKLKSRVIFSATLSPIDYFVRVIGGLPSDPVLMLPSPFPVDNLLLMVAPKISTKFANRSGTYSQIADYIRATVSGKLGNYIVYFPSYKYLNDVLAVTDLGESVDMLVQTQEMDDDARAVFLLRFRKSPRRTTVGFAVLGGAFAEGIDLTNDRLIGAIIVGVGLPQLSFERDLIRHFYDKHDENGYEYSYVNPGMNRVMQAVGRVIRSETDRGIVLLIDDRFLQRRYRDLFKHEWSGYQVVTSTDDVSLLSKNFWDNSK